MTYILGSRCSDGVVLVADRKFTIDYGESYVYDEKIIGEVRNVIIAFSGNRGTFELFRAKLRDAVTDNPNMSQDKFIIATSEIMENLSKKYHYQDDHFDAFVATGGLKSRATLRYFLNDGRFETISTCKAIGSGSPHGSILLDPLWVSGMNMEKVAELGTLIIKCIEKFELNNTVGVADNRPQIWFIPDLSDDDYEISNRESLWSRIDKATNDDMGKLEEFLMDLLGGYMRKLLSS